MKKNEINIKKYIRFFLPPIIYCAIILALVVLVCAGFTARYKPLIDSIFSSSYSREKELGTIFDKNAIITAQEEIDISEIILPDYETVYGTLKIENIELESDLYFGDSDRALKKGAAQFPGSFMPGFGKPILIAGHNNMHFNALKNISLHDTVKITTNYGEFVYEVTDLAIKKATDQTAYDLEQDKEQLILYTCYPFDRLGITADRFFVYADKVSGPRVIWQQEGAEQ